jgi:PhnB protein
MSHGIPADARTLTPHLIVRDAAAAIEFYKKAFGAVEKFRMAVPGTNRVMHAELRIGDSNLMLAEETGERNSLSPLSLKGTPVSIHVFVENVDEAFPKAIAAGAQEVMPVMDMFWGHRYGVLKDPFGHEWSMATKVRDVSMEEMEEAAKKFCAQPVS